MTIHLTPELEQIVERKVASGEYGSAAEVVQAALRSLEVREQQVHKLRTHIDEGIASLDRGEGIDGESFERELFAELDGMESKRRV